MFTRPTTYNWSASKQWFIPASRAPPPPPVSVEGDLALNLPGKKTFGRIFFSAKSRSLGSHGRRVFWCEVCLRSRKAVAYPRTGRMSCIFPLFCFTFFRLLFFFPFFLLFFRSFIVRISKQKSVRSEALLETSFLVFLVHQYASVTCVFICKFISFFFSFSFSSFFLFSLITRCRRIKVWIIHSQPILKQSFITYETSLIKPA